MEMLCHVVRKGSLEFPAFRIYEANERASPVKERLTCFTANYLKYGFAETSEMCGNEIIALYEL